MVLCGKRGCGDDSTRYLWLSSIILLHSCLVFFHRHILSQSPPSRPLNQSLLSQEPPLPWDCATIPKLQLPAAAPSRGPASLSRVWMAAARTVWFSFHLGCHRSAISLPALNVSPLTQTIAPMWGSDPCFSSPTLRAHPVLLTLLFSPLVPSSYRVLHGSIYSFLLVRYSCPPSAGVLHVLLCLKVHSWCICGEWCTPRPPTPPPFCLHFCILCFHFHLSLSIFNFPCNFFFDPLVVSNCIVLISSYL